MFPFNEHPISRLRTSSDIEKHGHQSLIRALNIGRVVAFVGSGTSLKFGQPTWGALSKKAAQLFFDLEHRIENSENWQVTDKNVNKAFRREFEEQLTPLVQEIKDLRHCGDFETGHFVELVEDYFAIVGELLARYGVLQNDADVESMDGNGNVNNDLIEYTNARTEARNKAFEYHKTGRSDISVANGTPGQPTEMPRRFKDEADWKDHYAGPMPQQADGLNKLVRNVSEFRSEFALMFESLKPGTKMALKAFDFGGAFVGLGIDRVLVEAIEKDRAVVTKIDVARTLRQRLGIRRYLTLNYDLELEMMLFEEGRASPLDTHNEFEAFVQQRKKFFKPGEVDKRGRAVTLESPSGRVIRSSSSRKETLADLFSFGAFPTNYDATVHHLHGRVDDPNNMIITPKDYQSIYYGESEQKKSFDEARHAVFTGSDLLVVGMGAKENDVLKPLRDFLELEADRRDAHGKVYYLTQTEFTGDEPSFEAAYFAARRASMARTQQLYKDYGMHTLFFDQSFDQGRTPVWTPGNARLMAARAEVAYYMKGIDATGAVTLWTDDAVKADFDRLFENVRSYAPPASHFEGTLDAQKLTWKAGPEVRLAREVAEKWNEDPTQSKASRFKKALQAIDGHLRDRGLVDYAESLQRARRSWWENWSNFPGLRVAMLGPHRYSIDKRKPIQWNDPDFKVSEDAISSPLIWRQTNLEASFRNVPIELGNGKDTPQFTGLINETALARKNAIERSQTANQRLERKAADAVREGKPPPKTQKFPEEFPASVARISIPPGGGKGRLMSFFAHPQKLVEDDDTTSLPFQALFNRGFVDSSQDVSAEVREVCKQAPYKACFTAHLTHALEFSSSMVAFARLLQQFLPTLKAESMKENTQDDLRWKEMIDYQFQGRSAADPVIKVLRSMFELLKDKCPQHGWNNRMVVMVSYLDRLVDDRGDAYSPIHRAFFRMISGWDDADAHLRLPIDVVLINSRASNPIRYLSNEEKLDVEKDDRRDQAWQNKRWERRIDRKVALEHWTELPRVRPRVIFMEALEHAGTVLKNAVAPRTRRERADTIFRHLSAGQPATTDNDFLPLPPNLKQFMYRRVVNGHMMAGLADAIWVAKAADAEAFKVEWDRCISALDMAHAREKTRGVIDEFLSIYRRLDREKAPRQTDTDHLSRMGVSDEVVRLERFRTMVIDHLALLNFPITADTLAACPDVKRVMRRSGAKEITPVELQGELDSLVARGLAARYCKYAERAKPDGSHMNSQTNDYVYALDTRVAAALRARANLEVYSQYKLMSFQPNVYPSQPERALKPDPVHFRRVSNLVRALVKTSHRELVQKYWDIREDSYEWSIGPEEFSKMMEAYNDKLRAAYALVRSTFSISVIARLAETGDVGTRRPFDEYRTWTRKLLNTATLLSEIRAHYMAHFKDAEDPLPFNHTFLRDEVSWLYNERALVSFVQGRLFDALPLFEQSRVMLGSSSARSEAIEDDAMHRRLQMNHALAQVERGNIIIAKDSLERIIADTGPQWSGDTPSVIHCMANGYLALCYHLTNEFSRAKEGYEKVLAHIGQFNHPRAESIFRRHYADLLRTMFKSRDSSDFAAAIENLRSAEELAIGLRATDLYHYALMAQARLHRDMLKRNHALESLRHVEAYARTMGIQKMLCEVLKVRGEVLLADGETTQAGFVTSQSIAIAKRNGMRLRKISASIIQAKIMMERDQRMDAQRLVKETIIESQNLGYAHKTSQASALLRPQY